MNVSAVGSAWFQGSGYAVMFREVFDAVLGRIIVGRGGDTTSVLDLTIATVVSGEVCFKADLSALGCFPEK